jgi:hypothetical protein
MGGTIADPSNTYHAPRSRSAALTGIVTSSYPTDDRGQRSLWRECPVGVMDAAPPADEAEQDWFLRPKGGTRMTAAQIKRKIRNSPFASLQTRISLSNA